MPNWTLNALELDTSDVPALRLDEHGGMDFDRWKPMPESLRVMAGGWQRLAMAYAASEDLDARAREKLRRVELDEPSFDGEDYPTAFGRGLDGLRAYGERLNENVLAYGVPTWYEWRVRHWGTKWNACDTQLSDYGNGRSLLTFDTAWAQPKPELMGEILSGLKGPWTFEASYEGDILVCDADGDALPESSWKLFGMMYEDEDGNELTRDEYELLVSRDGSAFSYAGLL